MKKQEVLKGILDAGVIAVIRGDSKEEVVKIMDAVVKGGIKILELTMTVPKAIDILKEAAEKYENTDVIVGAGTVLDAETGSNLTKRAATGDYEAVEKEARRFVEAYKKAKENN